MYEIRWKSSGIVACYTPRELGWLGRNPRPIKVLQKLVSEKRSRFGGWAEADTEYVEDTRSKAAVVSVNAAGGKDYITLAKTYEPGFRFLKAEPSSGTEVEFNYPPDRCSSHSVNGWDVLIEWDGKRSWHTMIDPHDAAELPDTEWDEQSDLEKKICDCFWEDTGLKELAWEGRLQEMRYDRRHRFSIEHDICCAL